MKPDFERAKQYVLQRLKQELSPQLFYHSLAHTRDDVVVAAERLAAQAGVDGEGRLLLLTAAWFHDIGFIERQEDNEVIAVRIMRDVLPGFGYSAEQIDVIDGIIMATKWPQSPKNQLEELMADADLDSLGREDFFERSTALRAELQATNGLIHTDAEWFSGQRQFLESHAYFTEVAKTLRNAGKQEHIDTLSQMIADCEHDQNCG